MKLNAEYDHHSQVVELRYDNEAQVVFGATGQVMNRLLKPPGSPDFLEQEPDWYEDIGRDLELLTRLGSEPSRHLRVQAEYLDSLFSLICCMTPHLLACGQSSDSLRAVLMLLSSNVPLPMPVAGLPPAVEVLNRKLFPAAWTIWEKLRAAKPGQQALSILDAYNLWFVLHKLPKHDPYLASLESTLDTFTVVFRWAMEDLALDDLMERKHRKGRK